MTSQSRVQLSFTKYHGGGNDFVVIDNRRGQYSSLTGELAPFLCHRNFGIGSDGLVFLTADKEYAHKFHVQFFNPDGSEPGMCGNALRCVIHFLHSQGVTEPFYEICIGGKSYTGRVVDGKVSLTTSGIYVLKEPFALQRGSETYAACQIHSGVPHLLVVVDNLKDCDVAEWGKLLRHDEAFQPQGTNVSFLQMFADHIALRTYERGVEGETLCCGSAVLATGYFVKKYHQFSSPVIVLPKSCEKITIAFQGSYDAIEMIGQAVPVFQGCIEIESNLLGEKEYAHWYS